MYHKYQWCSRQQTPVIPTMVVWNTESLYFPQLRDFLLRLLSSPQLIHTWGKGRSGLSNKATLFNTIPVSLVLSTDYRDKQRAKQRVSGLPRLNMRLWRRKCSTLVFCLAFETCTPWSHRVLIPHWIITLYA